ncbi:Remorin-related [Rhynchospora pubera]|uniref:Remorin-related n=1 Tax=Rhynchospora pubera TaxID=906938 RepID=A0AAV8BRB7_9POAL|nr:Remorin-related [Rhynchospora pubera]KAJ4801270.1 Remorin-related [Rhynchospora pubera]
MLHDQNPSTTPPRSNDENAADIIDIPEVRDIHPLSPPSSSRGRPRRQESWEAGSHHSSNLSEQFTTMSREFNAMVVAGSTMQTNNNNDNNNDGINSNNADNYGLARIGEDDFVETNPLAIVPDNNPIVSPRPPEPEVARSEEGAPVMVVQVKKEEVETKIAAWQSEEIAKVNNRFKREEVLINSWENEQVEEATARLKKIERKLEEQRAKAIEKTQNTLAKAHRKAEERRASAEAKRGLKVAKVLDLANFMRAVGRVPTKRSFF